MHRDEYFFGTDLTMTAVAMIEADAGRWNLETTFQEARCLLALESTRWGCRQIVLRADPCLFGLYTAVALLYRSLPESKRVGRVEWPGKVGVTFSDGPDLRASLAVAGMGFSTGRWGLGRGSTPRVTA